MTRLSPTLLTSFNQAAIQFDEEISNEEQELFSQKFATWAVNSFALDHFQQRLDYLRDLEPDATPEPLRPTEIPTASCSFTETQVVICRPSQNDPIFHLHSEFAMIVVNLGNPPNPSITYDKVNQFFQSQNLAIRYSTQTILPPDHVIHRLTCTDLRSNYAMGLQTSRSIVYAPYDINDLPNQAEAYYTTWDGTDLFKTDRRYPSYRQNERECLLPSTSFDIKVDFQGPQR